MKKVCLILLSSCLLVSGCGKESEKGNENEIIQTSDISSEIENEEKADDIDSLFEDFKKSCIKEVKEDGESDESTIEVIDSIENTFWDIYDSANESEKWSEFVYDMSYLECFTEKDTIGYEISQLGWEAIEICEKEENGFSDKLDELRTLYEENLETKIYRNKFESGQYKVGNDISPGEYVFFSDGSDNGYFCVSNDANGDNIIANENFEYNSIMRIKKGEYLELSDCYAVPIKEAEIEKEKANMLKVGTHINPGEYKLKSNASSEGYYCIYSDDRQQDIFANDNFEKQSYVKIKKGQYILLDDCSIISK